MSNSQTESYICDSFFEILSELLLEGEYHHAIQYKLSDDGFTVVKIFDRLDVTNRLLQFDLMGKVLSAETLSKALDSYSSKIFEACLDRISSEFELCL